MRNESVVRRFTARGLRLTAGLVLGALTAVAELLFAALAGIALLPGYVRARRRKDGAPIQVPGPFAAVARWLAGVERRRLALFLGHEAAADHTARSALAYVAVRPSLGLLGATVLVIALIGAAYGSAVLWGWMIIQHDDSWFPVYGSAVAGLVLLFLAVQGVVGIVALERQVAAQFLGPTRQEALRRRIDELASSRAGVVEAVHDERRRIERDLHDGIQQRLVALGMLLGRARRSHDADKAAALVVQAHEESQAALAELREVAWRVYPTALDEAGLRAALETVAERSAVPVRLEYGLAEEPETAVRTVAYFVVSEAVTNAVKHADATSIGVTLEPSGTPDGPSGTSGGLFGISDGPPGTTDGWSAPGVASIRESVRVRITDDGGGGADPSGSGLLGLARRVAALDGRLAVHSPPGGPTVVTAELPCA